MAGAAKSWPIVGQIYKPAAALYPLVRKEDLITTLIFGFHNHKF